MLQRRDWRGLARVALALGALELLVLVALVQHAPTTMLEQLRPHHRHHHRHHRRRHLSGHQLQVSDHGLRPVPRAECLPLRHRDLRFVDPGELRLARLQEANASAEVLAAAARDAACVTPTERHAAIRDLVLVTHVLLHRLEIDYWIDSGTLLGQYRMKDVLPWDMDADVGILARDLPKLREAPLPPFASTRYRLNVHNSSIHEAHDRDEVIPARVIDTSAGLYVDIFVFDQLTSPNARGGRSDTGSGIDANERLIGPPASESWNSCDRCEPATTAKALTGSTSHVEVLTKQFAIPETWVFPTEPCPLSDFEVRCPARPVPYLQHIYGDDFIYPVVW